MSGSYWERADTAMHWPGFGGITQHEQVDLSGPVPLWVEFIPRNSYLSPSRRMAPEEVETDEERG